MNSWFHAVSAQKKWGGTPDDYIQIEEFIDSSKRIVGDVRHRSIYHHTEGVWLCQELFGRTIELDGGRLVPVRLIAERHIEEDLGWLPSPLHRHANGHPSVRGHILPAVLEPHRRSRPVRRGRRSPSSGSRHPPPPRHSRLPRHSPLSEKVALG